MPRQQCRRRQPSSQYSSSSRRAGLSAYSSSRRAHCRYAVVLAGSDPSYLRAARLKREITGDVLFDRFSCGRYATDASFYQIMPAGVVVPRTIDEALRALAIARDDGQSAGQLFRECAAGPALARSGSAMTEAKAAAASETDLLSNCMMHSFRG